LPAALFSAPAKQPLNPDQHKQEHSVTKIGVKYQGKQ